MKRVLTGGGTMVTAVSSDVRSGCLYKLVVVFVIKDNGVDDIRAESVHVPAVSSVAAQTDARKLLGEFQEKNPHSIIVYRALYGLPMGHLRQPYNIML